MKGRFITLEGLDGAGKTTHQSWLAGVLKDRGISVLSTREPGGTPLGEKLRELLLGERAGRIHPESETLLLFAARREHLDRIILPALEAGTWVICDRFTDATYAYQAGGDGVAWERVAALEQWVHPGLQPHLTFYFDLSPALARGRIDRGLPSDRFEREEADFHGRVRGAYLRRAREDPGRIRIIDASRTPGEIQEELGTLVRIFCSEAAR
jgi:dTMP kinase